MSNGTSIDIQLPQWGMAMNEGMVTAWLVATGDQVDEGQDLVEVEAAKTTDTVKALTAGTVGELLVGEGETVPTNTVLCTILRGGAESGAAAEGGTDGGARVQIAPLARKLAKEAGIDLDGVTGSGPGGRIRPDDVAAAISERESAPVPTQVGESTRPSTPPARAASSAASPTSGMRKIIARRMLESLQTTAQFTITTTADVTDLVAYRDGIAGPRPTYADAVVRAVALALREHPGVNVRFEGGVIVPNAGIHVGTAVAVEGGLVVPVVRDADRLGLAELATRTRELVGAARGGSLAPSDMSGGSISVTSLGGQGIDAFTPILNTPESAIVGVGRTRDVPTRFSGELVWRQELTLSLTLDHRAVDGFPGAMFLERVVELLAQPRALV